MSRKLVRSIPCIGKGWLFCKIKKRIADFEYLPTARATISYGKTGGNWGALAGNAYHATQEMRIPLEQLSEIEEFLRKSLGANCEVFSPIDGFGVHLKAKIDGEWLVVAKHRDMGDMLHVELNNNQLKSIIHVGWLAHLDALSQQREAAEEKSPLS